MFNQQFETTEEKKSNSIENASSGVQEPGLYLKNLAEYQRMLELLSLNNHLRSLLMNDEHADD